MPSSPNVAALSLIEPIYIEADSTISLPPHTPTALAPLQCNQIISQVNENGGGERRKTEAKAETETGKSIALFTQFASSGVSRHGRGAQKANNCGKRERRRQRRRQTEREREEGGGTKQRGYHGHTHIYPFINGYVMRQGRKRV